MSDLLSEPPNPSTSSRNPPRLDLRALVSMLIEDGKKWVAAEIVVFNATAHALIKVSKVAAPLAIVAIMLVQAALTVLVAALGMALARWLGVAGGLAAGACVALLSIGGLIAAAISRWR
jgi:hypothetical protein